MDWRRLHNEDLHDLHSSPNIIMGLEGNVTRRGGNRAAYRLWWGNLWERDQLEDIGIDGRIVL
jgi:hypothetical protein